MKKRRFPCDDCSTKNKCFERPGKCEELTQYFNSAGLDISAEPYGWRVIFRGQNPLRIKGIKAKSRLKSYTLLKRN